MKIKEICEKTGLTDRTIRYYIEEQLISPFYTENYLGRKSFDFSEEDLERLKNIATLRTFGFSVEEIKELSSEDGDCQRIVERVKKRTEDLRDESLRRFNILSAIDTSSNEVDVSQLAQKLSSVDPTIENESAELNVKKRIASLVSSCMIFLAVWLPIVSSIVILALKISAFRTPIIRPVFLAITLLCFLPSAVTVFIFQKLKSSRRIIRILLMSLCILCLPLCIIFSSKSVVMCDHNYETYRMTVEATCQNDGENVMRCKICGSFATQKIEMLPHEPTVIKGVVPTCARDGLSDGSYCALCNTVLVEQTVLAATSNHTPVTDATVPATCKDTGLTEGSHCSVCDKVLIKQTVIPVTDDHKPVCDKAVLANCKDTGLTEGSHCSVCDKVLVKQTVIPVTEDHKPVRDKAIPAKCEETGLTEGSHCSVCNKVLVKQRVIAATGHSYKKREIQRTCGTDGYTLYECSCGDTYQTDVVRHTNEHAFQEKSSEKGYICKTCGLEAIMYGNADGSEAGEGNDLVKYYITGPEDTKYYPRTLVIYGTGDMPDFEFPHGPPWLCNYLFKVRTIIIESGITSFGHNAFTDSKYDVVREFIIRSKHLRFDDNSWDLAGINILICDIIYDY